MFLLFGIFLGLTGNVLADLSDVKYPILELNNCNSQNECKNFCDDVGNMVDCLNYAEKNNLMPKTDIEEARKVLPFLEDGTSPGSCKTKGECENYCDLDENFNECLKFAHDNEIISLEIYEIARETKGIGPGGCRRDECESFCSSPENFETCLDFVEDKGLIGVVVSAEDYSISKKMVPLIEGGKLPGGCNSENSCNNYCDDRNNLEECASFALEVGETFLKDLEHERGLKDFESFEDFKNKIYEFRSGDDEREEHFEADDSFRGDDDYFKDDEDDEDYFRDDGGDYSRDDGDDSYLSVDEDDDDEKYYLTTSKNQLPKRSSGSSGSTQSYFGDGDDGDDFDDDSLEDDNSNEGDSGHDSSPDDSDDFGKGISLVGEVILTEPEIKQGSNSEEKQDSLEEESGSDESHEAEGSHEAEDSSDERDSEGSHEENDKSNSEDSKDSGWTINSKVVAPFQKPTMPNRLFDFFKRIFGSFY